MSQTRVRMIASTFSALFALLAPLPVCQAQTTGSTSVNAGNDPTAAKPSAAEATRNPAGPTEPGTAHSSGGAPQTGVSRLTDRVTTVSRFAPYRESWVGIQLGTKYVTGVVGGLEQGASLGLGLQATKDFSAPCLESKLGGGLQYRYSHALAGRMEIGHSNEYNRFLSLV